MLAWPTKKKKIFNIAYNVVILLLNNYYLLIITYKFLAKN